MRGEGGAGAEWHHLASKGGRAAHVRPAPAPTYDPDQRADTASTTPRLVALGVRGPADFAEMIATVAPDRFPNVGTSTCGISGTENCGKFDHDGAGFLVSPADFAGDRAKALEGFPINGPSCGAACTPPLSGPIGSCNEILGKAICDGPAC